MTDPAGIHLDIISTLNDFDPILSDDIARELTQVYRIHLAAALKAQRVHLKYEVASRLKDQIGGIILTQEIPEW